LTGSEIASPIEDPLCYASLFSIVSLDAEDTHESSSFSLERHNKFNQSGIKRSTAVPGEIVDEEHFEEAIA